MAEVAVGTAKILLNMDASGMDVVLDRVQQKQRGLGDVAVQEAQKMTVAQRRVVDSLERAAIKVGMTREEWLKYRIATQTTGETQKQLLTLVDANTRGLERQTTALKGQTNERNRYGLTMKQEVAAMRQVPAQMTDIFVSLQGGQNPMTVLIQQGGQLKDVFGGVVPAARALSSQVLAMVNPMTLGAAAAVAMGAAYLGFENRINSFNRALIKSGQDVRMTADDLNDMAVRLDDIGGVTSRQAADAISQAVANGRIAIGQLETVVTAAVMTQDAFGTKVSETIEQYAEIGRDPVQAVLRLSETERFLTQEVYERIRAMQEAGDIAGAAALATETRAAAQQQMSLDAVDSLGLVSGAWHNIKESAGEAWDEAENYFGNLDRDAKEAVNTLTRMWQAFRAPGGAQRWALMDAMNPGKSTPTSTDGTRSAGDSLVNPVVQRQLDALRASNRDREERQRLEEEQIVNLNAQLGISKEDKRVQDMLAASRARYNESKPKPRDTDGGMGNAMSKAELQAIKDYEAIVRGEISNTGKILQAEYAARLVSEADYFQQRRALAERDFQAQEASLQQQIAALQARDATGKDAVNTSRELGKLEAELAKVRSEHATQQVILGIQEDDLTAKRQRAIDGYREALELSNESARMSVEAALARIMMGEREAAQQERIARVIEDGAQKRRALEKEFAETKDQAAYDAKLRELENFVDEQVRVVTSGYDRMREAQADWQNGLRAGWENWKAGAEDVAGQIEKITVNSLDAATDALTEFATTGKLVWRDLLLDIGEQIVRFMMQQVVLEFAKMFIGMWNGTGSTSTAGATIGGSPATNVGPQAKGGYFPSSGNLSAYSGSVVSKPTPFYFAKGAGVMGEAGMEGIFPLQRGSDGKLGVKAMGGGGAPVTIITTVNVESNGAATSDTRAEGDQAGTYKALADNMSNMAKQEIVKATLPGGILWKARAV